MRTVEATRATLVRKADRHRDTLLPMRWVMRKILPVGCGAGAEKRR